MKNTFYVLFCLFFFLLPINISFGQTQNSHTHYFENTFLGGQIIVDNITYDAPIKPPGYSEYWSIQKLIWPNDPETYSAVAINNQFNSSWTWFFSNWDLNGEYQTNNLTTYFDYLTGSINASYSIDHNAVFLKSFAISRSQQTEFNGTISNGIVDNVLEPNSTTIIAENPYTPSGSSIPYNFVYWTDNELSSNPRTITPTNNQTYCFI